MERVIQLNHLTISHLSSMDILDQPNSCHHTIVSAIKRHQIQQVRIETFHRIYGCIVYFTVDKLQVQTYYHNKVVRLLMFQITTIVCTKVQYLQFVLFLWYWALGFVIVYYVFGYVQV